MALFYSRFEFPGRSVGIRQLESVDRQEFLALAQASKGLHQDWIHPPLDDQGFDALLERSTDRDFAAMAVLVGPAHQFAGMIHLSQIFYGSFESAYLSYWLGEGFAGRGIMTEAMRLMLHYALDQIELHRLEANIQPGNERSIALVRRLGFVLEGYSEKYLKIRGQWRDHERWAIHREIWPERDAAGDRQPHWAKAR